MEAISELFRSSLFYGTMGLSLETLVGVSSSDFENLFIILDILFVGQKSVAGREIFRGLRKKGGGRKTNVLTPLELRQMVMVLCALEKSMNVP